MGQGAPASAPADWFHIFPIAERTYAISEPKYWQQNVSYLLLGTRQALLFDSGPGIYSIRQAVRSLTPLPVIVIPSHLHFDHVGDLNEFDDVRLLDTSALRAQVRNGYFIESSGQYMLRGTFKFRVRGWIKDGESIDLGQRMVRLISTPGHTPDSVSLVDPEGGGRLFTGDLINKPVTLCDVPGSDPGAMASSLHRLLAFTQAHSLVYEAHSETPLLPSDLEQLAAGIPAIVAGKAASDLMCLAGEPMRRFNVGSFALILPAAGGAPLKPLGSSTEEIDFEGGKCNMPNEKR